MVRVGLTLWFSGVYGVCTLLKFRCSHNTFYGCPLACLEINPFRCYKGAEKVL